MTRDAASPSQVERAATPTKVWRHALICALLVLAGSLLLDVASARAATTRYATPAGSTTHATCDAANPCTLPHAVDIAFPGDTINVDGAHGDYSLSAALDLSGLTLQGQPTNPKPRIISSAPTAIRILEDSHPNVLQDLYVEDTASTGVVVDATAQSSLSRVVMVADATGSIAYLDSNSGIGATGTNPTVYSSIAWAKGTNSRAMAFHNTSSTRRGALVRASTAWAPATGSIGFAASSSGSGNGMDVAFNSSIIHGGQQDITLGTASGSTVSYRGVNNNSKSPPSASTTVTVQDDGRQDAAPQLVAPDNGDFHEAPASPTIGRGDCFLDPTTDFEGDPRPNGATNCDIGADQFERVGGGSAGQPPAFVFSPPGPLGVSPTRLDFGAVATSAFASRTVTVTNQSVIPQRISAQFDPNVVLPNATLGFTTALGGADCSQPVYPGSRCQIAVGFFPSVLGIVADRLILTPSAQPDQQVSIPLSGAGIDDATRDQAAAASSVNSVPSTLDPSTLLNGGVPISLNAPGPGYGQAAISGSPSANSPLIGHDGSSLIGKNTGTLISDKGLGFTPSGILLQNGSTLIGKGTGKIISDNGSNFGGPVGNYGWQRASVQAPLAFAHSARRDKPVPLALALVAGRFSRARTIRTRILLTPLGRRAVRRMMAINRARAKHHKHSLSLRLALQVGFATKGGHAALATRTIELAPPKKSRRPKKARH